MPFWQPPNLAGLLASFSCPEEAYFKKLVVGKLQTDTEVEYYSGIPSTCCAASAVLTFANKCEGRERVGKVPLAALPWGRGLRPAPRSPACAHAEALLSAHTES